MSAEAAPQAIRQAAHLAILAIGQIAGFPHLDCDSALAISPRSQRHKQVNP